MTHCREVVEILNYIEQKEINFARQHLPGIMMSKIVTFTHNKFNQISLVLYLLCDTASVHGYLVP